MNKLLGVRDKLLGQRARLRAAGLPRAREKKLGSGRGRAGRRGVRRGADARRNGFRFFFFHNHDVEFTLANGRPIYEILLKETDPKLVKFELDIGWMEVSGQSSYELLKRYQDRFVAFHVKDIVLEDPTLR